MAVEIYQRAPKFKPKRAPFVMGLRSVACPTCQAAIGEPCAWPRGAGSSVHAARRRMVIRAANKARAALE